MIFQMSVDPAFGSKITNDISLFIHDSVEYYDPGRYISKDEKKNLHTTFEYGSAIWCREVLVWQLQQLRSLTFLTGRQYYFKLQLDNTAKTKFIPQALDLLSLLDSVNFSRYGEEGNRLYIVEEKGYVTIQGNSNAFRLNGAMPEIVSTIVLFFRYELFDYDAMKIVTLDSAARALVRRYSNDIYEDMWVLTAMFVRLVHRMTGHFSVASGPANFVRTVAMPSDYREFVKFLLGDGDMMVAGLAKNGLAHLVSFADALKEVEAVKGG